MRPSRSGGAVPFVGVTASLPVAPTAQGDDGALSVLVQWMGDGSPTKFRLYSCNPDGSGAVLDTEETPTETIPFSGLWEFLFEDLPSGQHWKASAVVGGVESLFSNVVNT